MKYFNIKKLFSDTKKVIVIVACALLLIGNIAVFASLSASMMLPSFLIIILSNIITILLTFAIYKPINNIIEEEVQERIHDETSAQIKLQEENHELLQQKKHMEDVAILREQKIKNLESELETTRQYKSISSNVVSTLKLETMEYEKKGFIVKEEYVRDTDKGREIEKDNRWKLQFNDKGEQKILYIKKFHEKAAIGINLSKIRFCRHNGMLYLEGVKFENLHPEMTLRNEDNSMERCMILNVENGEPTGINQSKKYEWFKHEYQQQQADIINEDFKNDVLSLCMAYSQVVKDNLSSKFSAIRFVDSKIEDAIDLADEPIYQLCASHELDIMEVSNSITLIANTIYKTAPLAVKN